MSMVYISVADFYEKVSTISRLSREEEIECAKKMKSGDTLARQQLIESYLPMVAGHMKRLGEDMQTLRLLMELRNALEKAVDSFNFLQESETFAHRLSWFLRQATTSYIARR